MPDSIYRFGQVNSTGQSYLSSSRKLIIQQDKSIQPISIKYINGDFGRIFLSYLSFRVWQPYAQQLGLIAHSRMVWGFILLFGMSSLPEYRKFLCSLFVGLP